LHNYKAIANLAGLLKELENEDLMSAVRAWLESQSNWLLILDNADTLEYFQREYASENNKNSGNLYSFIRQGSSGTILWTTSDKKIVGMLVGQKEGINVDNMQVGEANELLATLSNCDIIKEDSVAIEELLERLSKLPIAISQAAAYMRSTSTSVAEYIQRLQKEEKRWELLEKSHPDRHRQPEVSNSVLQPGRFLWTIFVRRTRVHIKSST